jgi:hypothetical protein
MRQIAMLNQEPALTTTADATASLECICAALPPRSGLEPLRTLHQANCKLPNEARRAWQSLGITVGPYVMKDAGSESCVPTAPDAVVRTPARGDRLAAQRAPGVGSTDAAGRGSGAACGG